MPLPVSTKVGPEAATLRRLEGMMSWPELLTDSATSLIPDICSSVARSWESITRLSELFAASALASKSTRATPESILTALIVSRVSSGMAVLTPPPSQSEGPASSAFTSFVGVEALEGNQRRSGTRKLERESTK